jgi:hypothetical protein
VAGPGSGSGSGSGPGSGRRSSDPGMLGMGTCLVVW